MNWLRTLVAWGIFAAAVVTVEAAAGPLVTDPGSCTSGRVYLGNINESHPHHVQYNGLYIVQPNLSLTSSLSSDKPIYKHESRDLYLYHLSFSGPLIPDQWVIGSKPGHHDIALSSDMSTGAWRLWDKNTRTMVTSDLIKAQCVGEDVQTCNTGTLFLSGLSRSRFPSQMSRMGEYRLLTEVASLRPVYQQVGGAEEYLFYRDGMWWIGPDSGRSYGSMFNTDGAWRPEYIRDSWVVYKGNYLSQQPSVIITCSSSAAAAAAAAAAANEGQGQESGSRDFHRQSDYRHNDDDDSTDDQDLIPSSSLPSSSSSSAESSAMNPGVSCKENQINLAGLEVVSATGHSLLDIMFLRCTGNSRMTGSPGVLCRKDGTWSNPPVCERPAHLITPQQEVRAP